MNRPDPRWEQAGETVVPAWAVTFESTDAADVYQLAANWMHIVGYDTIRILCSSLGFTVDNTTTLTLCYRPHDRSGGPSRTITTQYTHGT